MEYNLLLTFAFGAGVLAHMVWTALRSEPESCAPGMSQAEHLDNVYEAHWDGLWRGHQMTLAGTFERRELDGICTRYLVEAGLDGPQAALTAIDELGI